MAIAVIYWHTLSCYRGGLEAALLKEYHADMKIGHHTAYQLAVSVFCGEFEWEKAVAQIKTEQSDLDYVIVIAETWTNMIIFDYRSVCNNSSPT